MFCDVRYRCLESDHLVWIDLAVRIEVIDDHLERLKVGLDVNRMIITFVGGDGDAVAQAGVLNQGETYTVAILELILGS